MPLPAPIADTHSQHTPKVLHDVKYSEGNALLKFYVQSLWSALQLPQAYINNNGSFDKCKETI